jgi:predicted AAA+ superfamily ATPase
MNSLKEQYKRVLKIDLPKGQSAFLWGARKTGKSTFLKQKFTNSYYIDLLLSDVYFSYLKEPHRFREEIQALSDKQKNHPIIVDEVQKVPALLDEIHWLIENKNIQFILCGSSARKLKRGQANLLGGRAWRYEMLPLTSIEIPDFSILTAMKTGLLPSHYNSKYYKQFLKAYVQDYLKEEIKAEGLVRNLPSFARFLDIVSFSNTELIVYSNIASDCGVDAKTVKEYFQILIDTYFGFYLEPLTKKTGRKTITATPKFYLFDCGLANHLAKTSIQQLKGREAGRSFENILMTEIYAYRSYKDLDFTMHYWRTKTDLEVDLILNSKQVYIEFKISDKIKKNDLKGLKCLIEEVPSKHSFIVCNEKRTRKITLENNQTITVIPYQKFLNKLWAGEII